MHNKEDMQPAFLQSCDQCMHWQLAVGASPAIGSGSRHAVPAKAEASCTPGLNGAGKGGDVCREIAFIDDVECESEASGASRDDRVEGCLR